jgi:ABC-type branched-subunit amino acid transport system ATPase component/ABC-type branched-subunit amino acid transport system permease subunit
VSALVAMGIVLVYRTNRVVNFAQGDLGALAPLVAVYLMLGQDWAFFPAFGMGLLAALAVGALVEMVIIRRFARSPRLILTVATIGVALLLQGAEIFLPQLFGNRTPHDRGDFANPIDFTFDWGPIVFRGSHLLAVLAVPVVAGALALFLRRNRYGKAARAAAESSDRALLLGIPIRRVNLLIWVLAAGLSATAAELRTLLVGVSIGTPLGPALLLRALAAAVIGRMESLTVTFAAALGLGIVEQAVLWDRGSTHVIDGVLFFLVMGGLLVQARRRRRGSSGEEVSGWSTVAAVRPVPPELRRLPVVRTARLLLGVGAVALLAAVPAAAGIGSASLYGTFLIYALVALSLLVLTGWAGQISLGQMAFVGFGAAVAGSLAQRGWDFFLTLAVAGLVGVAVAAVVGLPALRIRGPFLAVATFAFALAANSFFLNEEVLPWLVPDPVPRIHRPVLFGTFDLESEHAYYWFLLVVFALAVASVRSLRSSRTGRAIVAARENEWAVQSFGVNLLRARLVAFAVSGFLAALAGALFVYQQHGLSRSAFTPEESIAVFATVVFGGLGSILGVVLGAAWHQLLGTWLSSDILRLLTSAGGLLIVLLVVPGGLSQVVYGARDTALRLVARRRHLTVPSLLGDVAPPGAPAVAPAGGAVAEGRSRSPLLEVQDLDVAYGRTRVLHGVHFTVGEGEMMAVLGTNGAGKSTLLNAVSGLLAPRSGTVTFAGQDVTGRPANRMAADGMSLVPGGRGVFPSLTVAENFELAAWLYRKDRARREAALDRVLDQFPVLRDRWNERAANLSAGEQQMLTLGQAFIARPRLLLIDELSLGLAPALVERLLETVRAIHALGTTVVLVEQSLSVAASLAGRAVFLEKGEVRFDGPVARLLEQPDMVRAVFLPASGRTGAEERRPSAPRDGRDEQPVVLETRGLSTSFDGVRAVAGVDLTVRRGQVVGIIGHNGAGKTTLFDLICGYLVPSAGRVLLNAQDVTALPPDARAVIGLGRSFQQARLFPSMTVPETLAVALERHIGVRDPLAAALMSPASRASEREVAERVDDLVELLGLGAFANKFVSELSTGTRRVLELGCCLAHAPDVLLLDEPSAGLAQREVEALGPLLLDIRDRTGAALVVIEHDIPLVRSVADELVAMDLGEVIARGAADDVLGDPQVVSSYLGTSGTGVTTMRL